MPLDMPGRKYLMDYELRLYLNATQRNETKRNETQRNATSFLFTATPQDFGLEINPRHRGMLCDWQF